MTTVEMVMRVGLATVLGIAIGVERQWRSRMAGLQTMALVSMGSALFLILGAYTFRQEPDPTRVAAQIVTGIGFIGAGVIMKQGMSVTGLNTAATLWSTAAVGALAGAGAYREAITGAVIIVAANGFLHPLAIRMDRVRFSTGRENPPADYVFEVICAVDAEVAIKSRIVGAVTRPGFQLKSLRSFNTGMPNEVQVRAELSATTRDDKQLEDAVTLFSAEPEVSAVRWSLHGERAADWTSPEASSHQPPR